MKELGLSCGTFNPPHWWHLLAAQCAWEEFGLNKVLFIPNGQPVHKKNVLDKESRWELIVAATAIDPVHFEPCRIELDRQGPSYTLDTLVELKQLYGDGVRLNLIIGVDNIKPIPTWYKADQIFKRCRLLIAPRLNVDPDQARELAKNLPGGTDWEIIHAPSSDISSTMVRDWVRRGRRLECLVPPAVQKLLLDRCHYKNCPEQEPLLRSGSTAPDSPGAPPAPAGPDSPAAPAAPDAQAKG